MEEISEFSFENIKKFNSVIDLNDLKEIYQFSHNSSNWKLQRSVSSDMELINSFSREFDIKINNSLFWALELDHKSDLIQKIFNQIKTKIGDNFAIERCYVNGQSSLQDGDIHADKTYSKNPTYYTFLLYINPRWDLTWGGCTIFLNQYLVVDNKFDFFENDLVVKTTRILPKPNTGILFPSHYLHYAEGPSRNFRGVRMSLAFKLVQIV